MKFLKVIGLVIGGVVLVCVALGIIGAMNRPKASQQGAAPAAPAATKAVQAAAPAAASDPPTAVPATEAPAPTAVPEPTVEPPTAVPAVGTVGERREAGGIALTVMKVDKATKIGSFQKAKAGNVYVLVEVVLETTGRDEAPYNPFYFKAKDADGFEYTAMITTADNGLKSGKLASGEKVRGIVAFEVPEKATGLVLSYEPIVILGGYTPIKIALE